MGLVHCLMGLEEGCKSTPNSYDDVEKRAGLCHLYCSRQARYDDVEKRAGLCHLYCSRQARSRVNSSQNVSASHESSSRERPELEDASTSLSREDNQETLIQLSLLLFYPPDGFSQGSSREYVLCRHRVQLHDKFRALFVKSSSGSFTSKEEQEQMMELREAHHLMKQMTRELHTLRSLCRSNVSVASLNFLSLCLFVRCDGEDGGLIVRDLVTDRDRRDEEKPLNRDYNPDTVLLHREQLLCEELRMRPRYSPPLSFFAIGFDDLEQIATVCVLLRRRRDLAGGNDEDEVIMKLVGSNLGFSPQKIIFFFEPKPPRLLQAKMESPGLGIDVDVSCLASRNGGIKDSWKIGYEATKNSLVAGKSDLYVQDRETNGFLQEFQWTRRDLLRREALRDVRRRQAQSLSIGLVGGPLVTSTAALHEMLPPLPRRLAVKLDLRFSPV
ncbi:hypothetical protein YC2023_116332 [Brassica napus]